MKLETSSVSQTIEWAKKWAKSHLKQGSVVCLRGDLGAGKTHFVKGVAQAFGISDTEVNSPTFTLIHEYRTGKIPLFHFDCYRFKHPDEALEIGLDDYLYGDGICCIEWPERIESHLPENRFEVHISHQGNEKRRIKWSEIP